ncbi:unnamed protein product [Euphydryas editha]|uniref:Endonuclease/exonuclease/phosphatase domain-containing protein n=1 Tax=Euphydryas editha TaxID=104508 RepID=A0AAU9VDS3_EUPED|nr:unnamed protein product [Euphydryas editha]
MSVQRSPTRSVSTPKLSGSQPNLSNCTQVDPTDHITFRNKRKYMDDDVKTELCQIREQMTEMMAMLKSLTTNQNNFIAKTSADITVIKEQVNGLKSTFEYLSSEHKVMKSNIAQLLEKSISTDKKVEVLESDVQQMKDLPLMSPQSFNLQIQENFMAEVNDRNLRSKNIVIIGVPEPKATNNIDRKEMDKKEVMKIITMINSECSEPVNIFRLGKYNSNKNRPIKVCFNNSEITKHILRNRKKMNNDKINIYSDQTPQQKSYLKTVKKEYENRIKKGDKNLVIKYIKDQYRNITTKNKSLKFLYANVRSIVAPGKFDELKCIIKSFSYPLHVIILTETWIKSNDEAKRFYIPNYSHYYSFRPDSRGGGVSIYAHDNLKHTLIDECCLNDSHYIWIHLENFSLDVGAIYIKPEQTSIKNFLDIYPTQLHDKKRNLVFGDFNINLLNTNRITTTYMETLQEYGLRIINQIDEKFCTRETNSTKTIIDHVCSNLKENQFHMALIESPMSDHKQIYLELQRHHPDCLSRVKYEVVSYNKLNEVMSIIEENHENSDFSQLEERLVSNINKSKIIKTKILNPPRQDWIDGTIIDQINNRNILWKAHKISPNDVIKETTFKKARNEVTLSIRKKKAKYYCKMFGDCRTNPAKMWSLLNNLCVNKVKEKSVPEKLQTSNGYITNKKEICECFNNYFSTIGLTLANNIKKTNHNNSLFITSASSSVPYSLSNLTPATTDEILSIINNLKTNTSSGLDGISSKTIKCIKHHIQYDKFIK